MTEHIGVGRKTLTRRVRWEDRVSSREGAAGKIDRDALEALKKNGLAFAQSTDWDDEVDKIANEIYKDLAT